MQETQTGKTKDLDHLEKINITILQRHLLNIIGLKCMYRILNSGKRNLTLKLSEIKK